MFEAKEAALQLVHVRAHVLGQLLQGHGGVQLQVGPYQERKSRFNRRKGTKITKRRDLTGKHIKQALYEF